MLAQLVLETTMTNPDIPSDWYYIEGDPSVGIFGDGFFHDIHDGDEDPAELKTSTIVDSTNTTITIEDMFECQVCGEILFVRSQWPNFAEED